MFITCIPCLRTRGFIKEITNHIKGLSLKVSGVKEKSKTTYSVYPEKVDFPRLLGGEATDSTEKLDTVIIEVKDGEREEQENEWISEPEPGVFITLFQLPHGGNLLKKISFSKELFDEWQAERWWKENWEKIVGLYSITEISSQTECPPDQENQIGVEELDCSSGQGNSQNHCSGSRDEDSVEISRIERGGEAEAAEWMVEHEPGVFVTLRSLPNGSQELVRVELMSEKFGKVKAIVWWEENKERLEKQYSCFCS